MGLGDTYSDAASDLWGYIGAASFDAPPADFPRDWAIYAVLEAMRASHDAPPGLHEELLSATDDASYQAAVEKHLSEEITEHAEEVRQFYAQPSVQRYWQTLALTLRVIDTSLVPLLPDFQPIFDKARERDI